MRSLALALVILAGCQDPMDDGALYGPCKTAQDCDLSVADGCALDSSGEGWCTIICESDKDCPAEPTGLQATCIQADPVDVCALPMVVTDPELR